MSGTDPRVMAVMMDPGFHPESSAAPELIQTHISYIFLVGDLVYKVKKPVDFGFLDFTTLEKRRHYCLEELRLNRRLAADTYLCVRPLVETGSGALKWGDAVTHDSGGGNRDTVIEWVLIMRRLPEERMLKHLLSVGAVGLDTMEAIARKVARFHADADTGGEINRIGGVDSIRHNNTENFEQTERYAGVTIPRPMFRFIRLYDATFFTRHLGLLEDRVHRGRVRDCHGDLHLEHVCLAGGDDGITIFDCIEFNRRFRYSDVACEVAFLYMDLDFNGYSELAEHFVDAYVAASGDSEVRELLNFFACYRAYVRGKVISFRLDDAGISQADRDEAALVARKYFELAFRYAARFERPSLVMVGGLMGTGKSTLAAAMAGPLQAEVIRTDVVRKRLAGVPEDERHHDAFGAGLYSSEMTERTYKAALAEATRLLQAGRSVIVDASWSRRRHRERAVAAAREGGGAAAGLGHGAAGDVYFVECVCAEEVVKRRLEARVAEAGEASDGRWELFAAQRDSFEPVAADELMRRVTIDCSQPVEQCVYEAVEGLRLPGPANDGEC